MFTRARRGGPGLLLALFALLTVLGAGAPAVAKLELPSRPLARVSDFAGFLSPGGSARIEALLAEHEAQSSDQIVVAIFPSLDGEEISDVGIRLAELWKIGTGEHDNGVILLLFIGDRRSRIEVGYGLEGRLTDALASRILRDELAPRLRAGDPDGGVEAAVRAIIASVKGEYTAPPESGSGDFQTRAQTAFFIIVLLIIFGPPILSALFGRAISGGSRGWGRSTGGWGSGWGGGFGSSGGGSSSSSSGGSSWSGGGGGSFGGGGSSGGW